jgi:prephenate dehydrogenase
MKKVAVIGLGIIGGSICASLTKAGIQVDGTDKDESAVKYALAKGYIQGIATDISLYDVVFIAIPPMATISVLETEKFKDGALVSDICGVKSIVENAVYKQDRNYRYVGIHPMAGKETSGISSASSELFNMANLIIVWGEKTEETAVAEIKEYAKAMRFGKIVECSAEEHDRKIALTSQLAHIVSNAYVKSPEVKQCDGFTGGSFQDMTRIAGVDEQVWTPLYACNRENVIRELDELIVHLQEYRDALVQKDDKNLKEKLKEGRLIRETIRRPND